jgi:hypothetical protein
MVAHLTVFAMSHSHTFLWSRRVAPMVVKLNARVTPSGASTLKNVTRVIGARSGARHCGRGRLHVCSLRPAGANGLGRHASPGFHPGLFSRLPPGGNAATKLRHVSRGSTPSRSTSPWLFSRLAPGGNAAIKRRHASPGFTPSRWTSPWLFSRLARGGNACPAEQRRRREDAWAGFRAQPAV